MEPIVKMSVDNRAITLDISDEACAPFGLLHNDTAINPSKNEVKITGVAPGNDGVNVLWYVIQHPNIKDKICYWGGKRNLIKAGFRKLN